MKKATKQPKKKKTKIRSVAVLCSGGDAPGMNAALRAVVRSGIFHGLEVYGVYKGYSGLLEGNIAKLSLRSVANVIQRGGTVIKTDRCRAFFQKSSRAEAVHLLKRKKIDALIAIGGEGTFTGAYLMAKENDFPVIGVPGTIDNDVFGTEYTIGFDSAVNTALDAIDKIRDTASAHDRVFLVEVMGRTSAEIAIRVGISGGAEIIVVPGSKAPLETDATSVVEALKRSVSLGKLSSIVVVAEADEPGRTYRIAKILKDKAKIDSRVVVLGHVQRGGTPSAMDRYMASLMGAHSIDCLLNGNHGVAVSLVNGKIAAVPLKNVIGKHKPVDQKLLKLARVLAS